MSSYPLPARVAARLAPVRRRAATLLRGAGDRVDPGRPAWRLRLRVGGMWDVIGPQQFEFVRSQGLEPSHKFIEIGCGVLRGGRHFIDYLDTGNYYGIDISEEMIRGSHREVAEAGLEAKQPTLRVTDSFDIDFGVQFDYGIAVSVFTHIPWNSCYLALANLSRTLAPGGRFYATYFPAPDGPARFAPIVQAVNPPETVPVTTYGDRNPYHYSADEFAALADHCGLNLHVIGDWQHPRGQHMLCFERPAE